MSDDTTCAVADRRGMTQTDTTAPRTDPVPPGPPSIPPAMWRAAGLLALAQPVSFVAAVIVTGVPVVHEGQRAIEHSWTESGLVRTMAGGYVLVLGLLCLLAAATFLSRAVGRRTETGQWAAGTGAAAGLLVVVIIIAGGLAPGAAATWGFSQGLELETALAVNNVRNFAYFIVLPVMGVHAAAVGVSALTDPSLPRWLGRAGVLAGALLLLGAPAAAAGFPLGMPVWLSWWIAVGVALLRQPGRQAREDARR